MEYLRQRELEENDRRFRDEEIDGDEWEANLVRILDSLDKETDLLIESIRRQDTLQLGILELFLSAWEQMEASNDKGK